MKKSFVWLALALSVLLVFAACGKEEVQGTDSAVVGALKLPVADGTELGEGEKSFTCVIADKDGAETTVTVHTDAETVGEALQTIGLLEGEEGPYGLFIKSVNGIQADFDKDGVYWAFYVGDEYAMSGVDMTEIEDGAAYAFRVEK